MWERHVPEWLGWLWIYDPVREQAQENRIWVREGACAKAEEANSSQSPGICLLSSLNVSRFLQAPLQQACALLAVSSGPGVPTEGPTDKQVSRRGGNSFLFRETKSF